MTVYLRESQLDKVRDAAIAQFLNPMERPLLFEGVMPMYVAMLPIQAAMAMQITSDLMRMNADERLVDSSVPLQQWLRNAARMTLDLGRRAVFEDAHDDVTAKSAGMPDLGAAAEVSDIKEAIVFTDDTLAFGFLAAGTVAGSSVGRILVRPYENGAPRLSNGAPENPHAGTGWLITSTMLVTNHHVINARAKRDGDVPMASEVDLALQAKHSTVTFDYDTDGAPGVDVDSSELLAWSRELDYAVVRLAEDSGRQALPVHAMTVTATQADNVAVNVIQHPDGKEKRVGLRNNVVYDSSVRDLRYFTDTKPGSSGSPVLTDGWRVCALHRGAKRVDVPFQGKTSSYVNVGTQISAILSDLQARYPALYAEIGV